MKILRKNDDFKKMPDSNINDIVAIMAMIDYGWRYCSRREYKDYYKTPIDNDNGENAEGVIEKKPKKKKK